MTKGKLYISCGIPGSGKTTYLKSHCKKDEAVISRDDIRFAILKEDEAYFSHEKEVFNQFVNIIAEHINKGINTYADATHLNQSSRMKLLNALKAQNCTPAAVEAILFDVPLDICLSRNEKRKDTKSYVPITVIRNMYSSLSYPIECPKVWIVDKDGNVSKSKG